MHTATPGRSTPQSISRQPAGWELLVNSAWDCLLHELSPREASTMRQVSQSWREDVGRALHKVHLVDPCPSMLDSLTRRFPGLFKLAVTLTHPWQCDHTSTQTLGDAMDLSHSAPSSASPAKCHSNLAGTLSHSHLQQQHGPGLHLRELSVHGWAGGCAACEAQSDWRGMPEAPLPLITWAAAAGKLRALQITRCAVPLSTLQVSHQLKELHLTNVQLEGLNTPGPASCGLTTPSPPSTSCSPLVAALASLPHLTSFSLLQHEPALLSDSATPDLSGLSTLPALASLHLAGPAQLLMQAAKQVPGWRRLTTLRLEAVSRMRVQESTLELHHLLSAMNPGSETLTTFSCSGHTYVSDRCLTMMGLLFPALRHVHVPLDEFAQDSAWNPFMAPQAGHGHPPGPVTRSGLQQWARSGHTLTSLHLPYVRLERDALECVLQMAAIEQLDLAGCQLVDDSFLYRLCASLPRLRHLAVAGCTAISDIGLAQLAVSLPYLTHLDISWCDKRVTGLGVCRLASLHRLSTLSIAGCHRVTDEGLRGLLGAPLRQHSVLADLNLSACNSITNTGLCYLASSAPKLARLSLDGLTHITSSGILKLAPLHSLQRLSVAWCSEEVQSAVSELACNVMGSRLGSLMIVPPGTLEAVEVPSHAHDAMSERHSSASSSTFATPVASRAASMSGVGSPYLARCPNSEPRPLATSLSSNSELSGSQDDLLGSLGNRFSGTPQKPVPQQRALRLKLSLSCVGFSPLSEPGRGYEKPWWLHAGNQA